MIKVDVRPTESEDFPSSQLAPDSQYDSDAQMFWHGCVQLVDFVDARDGALRGVFLSGPGHSARRRGNEFVKGIDRISPHRQTSHPKCPWDLNTGKDRVKPVETRMRCTTVRRVIEPRVPAETTAEYLGVTKDSVYNWIAKKDMPAHRVGRLWKFKVTKIDDWVRSSSADETARPSKPGAF